MEMLNISDNDNSKIWSYPISGFCRIPKILCSLSMATLCWNVVKPAIIEKIAANVNINRHPTVQLQVWIH